MAGGIIAEMGQVGLEVVGERKSRTLFLDRLNLSFLPYIYMEMRNRQLNMSVEIKILFGKVSV